MALRRMSACALFVLMAALACPPGALAECAGQRLLAQSTGVESIDNASDWTNVGSGITISRADGGAAQVLVIASFETHNGASELRTNELRLVDNGTPLQATREVRQTSMSQRYAIGSVLGLFHVPAGESRTFQLQHRASSGSLTTRGTLVALPLTTDAGQTLPHATAQQETDFESAFDAAGTYVVVPETLAELSLLRTGDIYLAASLDVRIGTGIGSRTGEWRLLWRLRGDEAWQAGGLRGLQRLSSDAERHVVSLAALLELRAPGEYEFALGFRRDAGSGSIVTSGASLAAVALSYPNGHRGAGRFPTWQVSGSHSTSNNSFVDALAKPAFLASGEQVYLASQYVVSANAATEGGYRLGLGSTVQMHMQHRHISSPAARSTGGSVWLSTAGAGGESAATLQQRRTGSVTVTQALEGLLIGIQLTSICEMPSSVVLGSFTARSVPGAIVLSWQADPHFGGQAFILERSEAADGIYTPLALIVAEGDSDGRYAWLDRQVAPGRRYYYRVESIGALGGNAVDHAEAQCWPSYTFLPLGRLWPH